MKTSFPREPLPCPHPCAGSILVSIELGAASPAEHSLTPGPGARSGGSRAAVGREDPRALGEWGVEVGQQHLPGQTSGSRQGRGLGHLCRGLRCPGCEVACAQPCRWSQVAEPGGMLTWAGQGTREAAGTSSQIADIPAKSNLQIRQGPNLLPGERGRGGARGHGDRPQVAGGRRALSLRGQPWCQEVSCFKNPCPLASACCVLGRGLCAGPFRARPRGQCPPRSPVTRAPPRTPLPRGLSSKDGTEDSCHPLHGWQVLSQR